MFKFVGYILLLIGIGLSSNLMAQDANVKHSSSHQDAAVNQSNTAEVQTQNNKGKSKPVKAKPENDREVPVRQLRLGRAITVAGQDETLPVPKSAQGRGSGLLVSVLAAS